MAELGLVPAWDAMTPDQVQRWEQMLHGIAEALSPGPRLVVVDGHRHAGAFADRLAVALAAVGQMSMRLTDRTPLQDEDAWRAERGSCTIALANGAAWRSQPPAADWDVVIWLRTPPIDGVPNGETDAHLIVDMYDPTWPVLRHIDERLGNGREWHLTEMRAFFAVRAATWDRKFGADLPAYGAAVHEVGVRPGGVVLDVGCGTGRALPALRDAVGSAGRVIGVDVTEQMLATAKDLGRAEQAALLLADACLLPIGDATVDVVFAAGLIGHVPDVHRTLAELARVTVGDGRLALFHPSGRAALAARHGRRQRPNEPLDEGPLRESMGRAGWRLDVYDDAEARFFALGTREVQA